RRVPAACPTCGTAAPPSASSTCCKPKSNRPTSRCSWTSRRRWGCERDWARRLGELPPVDNHCRGADADPWAVRGCGRRRLKDLPRIPHLHVWRTEPCDKIGDFQNAVL